MNNWWPWLFMGLGVVSLFLYRYRLFLLNNNPQVHNETIILESNHPAAPQAPAASLPQSRSPSAEKVQIEIDESKPAQKKSSKSQRQYASEQVWMPVIISLIVLLSALFVILSNNTYGDAQQKWAFGVVGTIIGYWFKK